jgi:hypothetical protein
VKPFARRVLSSADVSYFRERVGIPAEINVAEAEPFGIVYMDLDGWLEEHEGHELAIELEQRDA